MLLEIHLPSPPLRPFVEHLVFYEGYEPEHTKEKLLPDGAVEIVIDLTDTPKRLYHSEDFGESRSFRDSWISGMRRDYIVIEAAQQSSMAVIRFRPGGAFPFVGRPVHEITDTVTHLEDVFGAAAASLRDRILEAATPAAKFEAIEGFLLSRAGERLASQPAVDFLVDRMMDPGDARIASLIGDVGYSHRHTIALFKRWVGLAPKEFCRVRKFQQAVHWLTGPGEIDQTEVAHRCGYYDQAHFINEFRGYSGMTPAAYVESNYEYVNYLPLD